MMQTPDGHGRLELTKFHSPSGQGENRLAPPNTPDIRHIAFAVEDIDAFLARLRALGAELVGQLEHYDHSYRLCYVRGPEGIVIELAREDRLTHRKADISRTDPSQRIGAENSRAAHSTIMAVQSR